MTICGFTLGGGSYAHNRCELKRWSLGGGPDAPRTVRSPIVGSGEALPLCLVRKRTEYGFGEYGFKHRTQ